SRNVAARSAHSDTANTPSSVQNGVAQRSADAEATAARPMAKEKGATMLAAPNAGHHAEASPAASRPCARNANAAPRKTMPISAIVKGTYRSRLNLAKADGNAVTRPTIMEISQTWLASQTGPIASATPRRRSRARGPLA